MSILGSIIGSGIAEPIKAIGNIVDNLFTSDDERGKNEIAKAQIAQVLLMGQIETNQIEAQHRSIWVAGWRPAIGWICALGLFYDFFLRPIANGFGYHFPSLDSQTLYPLITGMLGFGALRTLEKFGNKTK